jgi:3D (Asp-Asp-Asp) domain-containing protein
MKTFEEHLRNETRKACLRDTQWRLERDRRRAREAKKMRRILLVAYIVGFLAVVVAAAVMVVTGSAEELDAPIVSDTLYDGSPIVDEFHEDFHEDFENEKIEQALLAKATRLNNVVVTHYCSELRPHICGTGDGITASGRRVTPYVSVAVDPTVIPLGADVLVDYGDGEIHYYSADDTGAWINGNHIDLAVTHHSEAEQLGIRTATVYWVAEED